MHGDVVLADQGFNVTEDLGLQGATLAIPAFEIPNLYGKSSLGAPVLSFINTNKS